MKTNETMMFALIGAAACSFFFGLAQREIAAQVQNCQSSCCEAMYAWWSGGTSGNSQQCSSAQTTGATYPFAPGTNTITAVPVIFVPVPSNPQNCKLNLVGNYDRWSWPKNLATCQNPDGTYPNPQGVTPSGTPTLDMPGANQNTCTPSSISF